MKDDLIGYLLDALEPSEQDRIERRIDEEPRAREELERLRAAIVPLAWDDAIEPPAGLAARTLSAIETVAGATAAAPGAGLPPPVRDVASGPNRFRAIDVITAGGVIAAALVLILPAISNLRVDQDRIVCAERLRSLGVALAMYADVERGRLPFVSPAGPMNNAGIFSVMLKARDLLPTARSLVCPSANNLVVSVPSVEQYLGGQSNPHVNDRYRRLMAGSYSYPVGYQEDGRHEGVLRGDGYLPVLADRPARPGEATALLKGNSPNHGGRGQNVLYADGRVRWLPTPMAGKDNIFLNDACMVGAGNGPGDAVLGVSEATPYPTIHGL